jgi:hypothetical protein
MSVLKRRSRIVSIRLSEEEYEAIMAGCISQGSRSISEFTRSVAFERATEAKDPMIQSLRNRIEELDRMVRHLNLKVSEIPNGNSGAAGTEPARSTTSPASAGNKGKKED